MSTLTKVTHRLHQGWRALGAAPRFDPDSIPLGLLSSAQLEALASMPAHDRAHLVRVYERLRRQGVIDRDLLVAALLHDIGKAGPLGRVRLLDRVLFVLLKSATSRLFDLPATGWRRGLAVAAHHAELGARHAADLGCSDRTCWLIRHHHAADPEDPALRLLQAADSVD